MARFHRQRVPSAPTGASRHARALESKTKTPYKVVFEQFTEKKRKLITVVSCETVRMAGEAAVDRTSLC